MSASAGAVGGSLDLSPRAVRARRGPKEAVDPRRPLGVFRERERRLDGPPVPVLTVLLAGAECPFTCVFCDLWRYTLDGATPRGAIPTQIDRALEEIVTEPGSWIKLYNASNWFDERAVPEDDDPALLGRLEPFDRVIVECHPRLVGQRARRWSRALGPGRLQVALGLETVDSDVQPRLGKGADLEDFARAIDALHGMEASVRVFVLVGLPGLAPSEAIEAAVESTEWAVERGVERVALVPLRSGNGTLDGLVARGELELPSLAAVEEAAADCFDAAGDHAVVTVDTWDLEALPGGCPECRPRRRQRLERANLAGRLGDAVACPRCP